jgi:hypothetical protein
MSALKSRINRLVRNNFVYFSPAELAAIRDKYKGYVEDEGATLDEYRQVCSDLEGCLDRNVNDGGSEYNKKVGEICRSDVNAYHAWMHNLYAALHNDHPDGLWLADTKHISIFLEKLEDARRYFSYKRDEAV